MDVLKLGFHDFLYILRRSKWYVLLAALIGGSLAVLVYRALPVRFTSEALLQVQAHSTLTKELNPNILDTTPAQVRTEVDILQSRAMADEVVRTLDLVNNPAFKEEPRTPTWFDQVGTFFSDARERVQDWLGTKPKGDLSSTTVELFRKRLQVSASEKSQIVSIYFSSGSAQLSADIVNTLLARYLAQQVAASTGVSADAGRWLKAHLSDLRQSMDEAAAHAQSFRKSSGLVDIQEGSISAIQLNEKEKALATAQQELSKARAAYDTAIASPQGSGFVGQEALGSLLIQRLREQESEIRVRLANLRERGGDNSPYLPPVMAELGSVRQQIATETTKIVASLKRDVETATTRVTALKADVEASTARAKQNLVAEATLAQLNQELDAKRQVYLTALTRMEQNQLASTEFPTARVVSAAVAPPKPDGMESWQIFLLGATASLFGAIGLVLLRQMIRGQISSARDMQLLTGITPIGSVPALPGGARITPVAMRLLDMKHSGFVETLHALRFSILELANNEACTKVLVTSSRPGEGKTTLAASLARLSAASGVRVLLVEADLRRPTLTGMLRVTGKSTIEKVLDGQLALSDAIYVDPKSGLHCLVSSGTTANAVAALQSEQFDALLAQAQDRYDFVVIDSPPVLNVIDALIVSRFCGVVLFTVACGRTSAATVLEAQRRFPVDVRSRIMTVLNFVPQADEEWRGYYSGYSRKALTSA